jgi:hypothetical protein
MHRVKQTNARVLAVGGAVAILTGCSRGYRAPAACDLLSADEITSVLQTAAVRQEKGSGFDTATGIDTCKWTIDGRTTLELRLYRADSSAESAWSMVFESARVHATKPDASGRVRARLVEGVGDDAMFIPGATGDASVAFRVGRTGAVIAGSTPEGALVALAKRAAGRL